MNIVKKVALVALALGLAAPAVMAQGPGGGGFNMGAFQKFRDQHKLGFQLSTTMTAGLNEIERSPSTALKPAQARQILGIIGPLRNQTQLSEDQARSAIKRLQRVLDQKQLAAVDRAIQAGQRRMAGGFGGGRPGAGGPGGGGFGGGRPGGGMGGPGGRPGGARFDPARMMRNFNPFHPDPGAPPQMYQRSKQRMDMLFGFLAARAAGKPAHFTLPQFRGGPGGGRPGRQAMMGAR